MARKTKMLPASTALPPAIHREMMKAAKRHGLKLSGLIRAAVEHWVGLELQELQDEKQARARERWAKKMPRARR